MNCGISINIDNIVESVVRGTLYESASPLLYHYITADNCIELLKNNRLRTCDPEKYQDSNSETIKTIGGDGMRFVSLTRNKNPKEGYPVLAYGEVGMNGFHGLMVRIEFDGTLMNAYNNFKEPKGVGRNRKMVSNHFKVKPMDWCYYSYGNAGDPSTFADNAGDGSFVKNGKEWMMSNNNSYYFGWGVNDDVPEKYYHSMSQAEDRLYTTAMYIPNINRYIRKIDILKDKSMVSSSERQHENRLWKIRQLAGDLNIPVNVYTDINRFASGR